jgi:hypothetical protein
MRLRACMCMTKLKAVWSFINNGARRAPAALLAVLVVVGSVSIASAHAQAPAPAPGPSASADLTEAKRLFDALEYEQAIPFLDRTVAALEPQAARDPAVRESLVAALQMRARARFGMGNREGAVADFRSLLSQDPGFALGEGVSPRVVAIFDEVKAATIGTLELALDPGDAQVSVDGVPRPAGDGRLPVAAGAHTLRVSRTGFQPLDQPFTVLAGQSLPLRVALERVSSVVTLVTTPPNTEVFVNGVSKGRTTPAAAPAAAAGQLGVGADEVGGLVLTDLTTGTFDIEFRRECFVTEKKKLTVSTMGDLLVDPVPMKPSVGILALDSEPTGATVFVDGVQKGTAPSTIESICAGTHLVEFSSPVGRAVERVALETGATLNVRGRVRPAFALLGADSGTAADARIAVERAFAGTEDVLLFAPSPDIVKAALAREPTMADWFGLTDGVAPPADARDRFKRLALALDTQGVAWVQVTRPGSQEIRLALAAPGSAEPDPVTVVLDQPDSVKQAIDRLRTPLTLTRGSLGLTAIDVLDVKGAVIVEVEPGQAAAEAGLNVGDVIEKVDHEAVESALDVDSRLTARQPGEQVALDVRPRAGAPRTVTVALRRIPVLFAPGDRFLPANVVVAVLRARLATTTDPALQPILRLNLASALLRAGDPADARTLLEQTTLPDGPGVSNGTVQYLLGEAALALGDQAAAKKAWEAAGAVGGRLTDDGPSVKALSDRALARLRQ